jgi:cytoskeletal protein RodZ
MSLSMDEQRMLAEIERRLSAEDPKLAAKLSAFRRPGPAGRLRSPRGRIIGSLFTVALVAVISMMVYAMVPFRAHVRSNTTPQASSTSAPARTGQATSAPNASAQPRAGTSTTSKITAPKTTAPKSTAPKSTVPRALAAKASGHQGTTGASTTSVTTPAASSAAR